MLVAIAASAAFWVVLTDGATSSWVLGVPAISFIAWMIYTYPVSRDTLGIRYGALLSFLPWFVLKSVRGGVEISRLALSKPLSLAPKLFEYHCSLANPRTRALFAMCLNVMLGTTTVRIDDHCIVIHTITDAAETRADITELEKRISDMLIEDSLLESPTHPPSNSGNPLR